LRTEPLPAAELIYIPFFLFFFILQFFIEPFDLLVSNPSLRF